jgi:hypothetical protein
MRFMMLVKGDEKTFGPPPPKLLAAIDKLTAELSRIGGELIEAGGLMPSAMGGKVKAANGKITFTDGPFSEAKELIGGYAILSLPSKEAAIEEGKRFMQAHIDVLGPSYNGELEIRQLADFPEQEERGARETAESISGTPRVSHHPR